MSNTQSLTRRSNAYFAVAIFCAGYVAFNVFWLGYAMDSFDEVLLAASLWLLAEGSYAKKKASFKEENLQEDEKKELIQDHIVKASAHDKPVRIRS